MRRRASLSAGLGLAGALRKIANDPEVLEVANKATQHMYIVNPIKAFEKRSSSMWDTHPPLAERISVLESLAGVSGVVGDLRSPGEVGPSAS